MGPNTTNSAIAPTTWNVNFMWSVNSREPFFALSVEYHEECTAPVHEDRSYIPTHLHGGGRIHIHMNIKFTTPRHTNLTEV